MIDALNKLIEEVASSRWDHSANGAARTVFPYNSDANADMGLLALGAFNGSLDAAKALHEALLPGWEWGRMVSHGTMVVATKTGRYQSYSADADNPARAWLLATLRAYAAQQEVTP